MIPTNPLLEWLRAEVIKHDAWGNIFDDRPLVPFGSHALFGAGQDRDFMIDLDAIPAHLKEFIPAPTVDVNYAEPFCRLQDLDNGFDFLICEKRRVLEFEFAMRALQFMQHDRPEEFASLKGDKPLRVATFRMARFCCPGSELVAGDTENPGIDSGCEKRTLPDLPDPCPVCGEELPVCLC